MVLNVVECRKCGASYWFEVEKATVFESGPCCFSHEVLDVERFPTQFKAAKAYPAWVKRRDAVIKQKSEANV